MTQLGFKMVGGSATVNAEESKYEHLLKRFEKHFMMLVGKVESHLKSRLATEKTLLFILIDSEVSKPESARNLARMVEAAGAAAILVGGSSAIDQIGITNVVKAIKESVNTPIILFPGNVTGVAPGADAILFTSLMNSENPYFITQAQALGAPSVLRYGLEPIPTAYLIIGSGTSAWFVGSARGIPPEKPQIAAAYSLAAQFMGMRAVYLEAGSGSAASVPPAMIKAVRAIFDGLLIVGGGIRDAETARRISLAGADAIVIGTILEKEGGLERLREMADAVRNKE